MVQTAGPGQHRRVLPAAATQIGGRLAVGRFVDQQLRPRDEAAGPLQTVGYFRRIFLGCEDRGPLVLGEVPHFVGHMSNESVRRLTETAVRSASRTVLAARLQRTRGMFVASHISGTLVLSPGDPE